MQFEGEGEVVVMEKGCHLQYAYSIDLPCNPDNMLHLRVVAVDSRMVHMWESGVLVKVIWHTWSRQVFAQDRREESEVEE